MDDKTKLKKKTEMRRGVENLKVRKKVIVIYRQHLEPADI